MKIMRYFPLIALAILGFIGYSLYKTSNFINKQVNSETLLLQDSSVQKNNDSISLTTVTSVLDNSSSSDSSLSTSPATGLTSVQNNAPNSAASQIETTPAPPTTTSIATTLATPEAKSSSSKTTTKTEAQLKANAKKEVKTTLATKTESNGAQTAETKTDKALASVKKAPAEQRFHVIIGSYSKEANAKAKAAEFEKTNSKKATVVKQGGFFRVCADEFEFSQAATQYAQKLKEAGEDNIILKF